MDISGLSDSGLLSLAQAMNADKLQEKISTSVMKMANDQAKQEGQNALELISSAEPSGALGHNVNVWA